jgi:hypothetical protein
MRPRKSKLSIDLNKPVPEREHRLENGSNVKKLIKTKVEADKEMDDNHQVQFLKKKSDDMRQKIKNLQQQTQALQLQYTKM